MNRHRERVILLVGGALHAALVWQAWIGVFTVGIGLTRASWEIEREHVPYGLSLAALLVAAVPFGWFCMRLAAQARPWRAELAALAVTIPLIGLIGTAGSFARYFVRTDLAAASFWTVCIWVGVVLCGAVGFYLIGRRDVKRSFSGTERESRVALHEP